MFIDSYVYIHLFMVLKPREKKNSNRELFCLAITLSLGEIYDKKSEHTCAILIVLELQATLQCVAVYCSVLQCVAVRCGVLQCVAVCHTSWCWNHELACSCVFTYSEIIRRSRNTHNRVKLITNFSERCGI